MASNSLFTYLFIITCGTDNLYLLVYSPNVCAAKAGPVRSKSADFSPSAPQDDKNPSIGAGMCCLLGCVLT